MAAMRRREKDGKEVVEYVRIYCKLWRCLRCGPRNAVRVCKRIGLKAREHGLSRFVTLTVDPSKLVEGECPTKQIRNTWRKLRVYLKREFGKSVSFICVMELHKSGLPHLHLLIDRYIQQSWLSKCWSRVGGGPVVYITRVKDLKKIGWYLGKYLTKDTLLNTPAGTRRYSSSRNVKMKEEKEEQGWRLASFTMDTLRRSAGSVLSEEIDENGNVKSFTVEKEIDRAVAAEYGGPVRSIGEE